MQPSRRYTYQNAGFNSFIGRSMKSNPFADNVNQGISQGSGKPMNLDLQQTFGALGNKIPVGRVVIDGANGRIIINNESNSEEGRVGNLSE